MSFFDIFLIIGFIVLVILRVPVCLCMLLTAFCYSLMSGALPISYVTQTMVSSVSSFTMLAVPLFMAVGELMNATGVTEKLFDFADCLVGHIRGGLAHVNILASLFFSGVSGSAAADAAGLGNIEIKAMTEKGFDKEFAVGITAASSIIGPIFPPSGPMLVFGTLASISVGSLFMGGVTIGIIMTVFLMVAVFVVTKGKNYPVRKRAKLKEIWSSFKGSFWALLMPPLLMVGMTTGIVTTTEVAALALLYALFLGIVVYRKLTLKKMVQIMRKVIESVGMIMMLISAGSVFAGMLGVQRVPANVGNVLFNLTDNKYLLILIILAFILFLGTFMETTAAILICVPLLMPIVNQIGMDPVQFGIMVIFGLMIGLLTPPMAICLFITSKIGGISFESSFKAVRVYYIVFILILLMVAFIPQLTLWLPRLLYGAL
ncbi:MAG: TRAP transporter large permease [Lachnospiraceae bacterium]|jgi:C4-dicarboxylate transporter DctM subunit|nr:TRAP transporter large permease [Lachnospiraceae bacterium]MCI9681151.1 TRAP transporter large permease [Lachnospiraceae bacterium]